MKTNVGIETTDEEREQIAKALGLDYKLAKRDDIKTAVLTHIRALSTGQSPLPEVSSEPKTAPQENSAPRRSVLGNFKPSRGDEPYLLKVEDERLRELASAVLDATEALDAYIWEIHRGNER